MRYLLLILLLTLVSCDSDEIVPMEDYRSELSLSEFNELCEGDTVIVKINQYNVLIYDYKRDEVVRTYSNEGANLIIAGMILGIGVTLFILGIIGLFE